MGLWKMGKMGPGHYRPWRAAADKCRWQVLEGTMGNRNEGGGLNDAVPNYFTMGRETGATDPHDWCGSVCNRCNASYMDWLDGAAWACAPRVLSVKDVQATMDWLGRKLESDVKALVGWAPNPGGAVVPPAAAIEEGAVVADEAAAPASPVDVVIDALQKRAVGDADRARLGGALDKANRPSQEGRAGQDAGVGRAIRR